MNTKFTLFIILSFYYFDLAAQEPDLPTKGELSQTILTQQSFSSATEEDIAVVEQSIANEYTLEVVAKVNSASGRGLDIESRNDQLKGFRLTLDASSLKWTSSLAAAGILSSSTAGALQTIRIAVKGDMAHIYQNGAFIASRPLSTIKNIVDGEESDSFGDSSNGGSSLTSGWAGTETDNTGKPGDYGWAISHNASSIFNTANSGSGVRYIDVNETTNRHTLNDETYFGRIMFIRWDAQAIKDAAYSYPVTLEANTTYDFSMLHAYWSNATGGRNITVGIGTTPEAAGRYATQVFSASGTAILKRDSFVFTSQEAGTYYLTFTGDWALFSISDLQLKKLETTPRFIFGKNYPEGAVDMEISAATYEVGTYAPESIVEGPRQDVTVTAPVAHYPTTFNTNFVVPGQTELHFTNETTPFINSSVELGSNDAWLYFDHIRPAVVIANWLDKVTINGAPAVHNTNVRIAIYKNGTAVIPNGNLTSAEALEVYTQPNLAGDSRKLGIAIYHNKLEELDNAIQSFKLRKGYMATLASNADGTGFSRVFIADEADLVLNTMPEGLEGTVSFIRVFRWDWVSKKGKAGWSPDKINATWYYDWNIGGSSASNYDYVAIRQNGGWPSWGSINGKQHVNHLLGHNEPDRPDQANMTVDQTIAQWPDMMKSGMRVGSPAPSDPFNGWLPQFMKKAEALNYRVDFAAIHCYWGGMSPQQWYDRLKQVHNMIKRPLWITEWNNGANWTTESWPAERDARFEKQLNDLKGILLVLDTASFVERYAIYDWVEDKRAMVLGDTLTPAGKYYAANKSNFAFSRKHEYIHTLELIKPVISSIIHADDYSKVTLSWRDRNGEFASKYILERKIEGTDTDFAPVLEMEDYEAYGSMSFVDGVHGKATYRIRVLDADGGVFGYSDIHEVVRDAAPVAPSSLSGEVVSSTILKLNWSAAANARTYNLKRSASAEGPFETILERTNLLEYQDEGLTPNTTYYYVVTALNSAGESGNSTVLTLKTNALTAPEGVQNPRIAAGDSKVTLSWDFIHDATYDVLRAESEAGTYATIATDVDAVRYADVNVTNGSTYYYKIIAHNEAGRSPESQVLTARPVDGQHLYISFNEATGTLAEDVWGGYHGTLAPAAAHAEGKYGQAVELDGTADAYVSMPEGIVSDLNDFTISTWVKMEAVSNWMRIFDFGSGTSSNMFLTAQAGETNGQSNVRYAIKNGGEEQRVNHVYTFPLGSWVHFAITQAGNTAKLYINGEMVASNAAVSIKPADLGLTTQNYIGKSQYPDPILNGSVDEFRIYNYALTDTEVQELLAADGSELKELQTITFNAIGPKEIGDEDFDAGAVVSSGLPLSYTSANPSVAVIENGLIRIVGAGVTTITASQHGNEVYAPAVDQSQELVVSKKAQSITFTGAANRSLGEADFDAAIASSGLPVSYSSSNEEVAIVVDGKLRLVGIGTTTITATQAGNEVYLPAETVSQAIEVTNKPPLSVDGDMEDEPLKVYPNPVASAIFINGLKAKAYEYSIFNPLGIKIATGIIQDGKIEVPASLPGGGYLLQVSDNEQILIKTKILIQK